MAKTKEIQKRVTLHDPKTGTKVTVGEKQVEAYTKRGYTETAPKA